MKRYARGVLPFCLLLIAGCPKPEVASDAEQRLDNGLRFIVRPVADAPTATVLVLYDIGSDQDPKGKSGLAHFVEHIYVTAAAGPTKARTAQELVAKYPAGWNAQTGTAYTVIATVVPAASVHAELEEAGARMGALSPTAADIERERQRLLEELENMFARFPPLAAINNASERVRPAPGGRKGGLPEHIRTITLDEVTEHWAKYYKPRNATLVVLGGIDAKDVTAKIKATFGELPSGAAAPTPAEVPALSSAEPVLLPVPLAAGTATVAYRAPQPGDDGYAAFLTATVRLMRDSMKSSGGRTASPLNYTPLDYPDVLTFSLPMMQSETPDEAVNRAHGTVRMSVTRPLTKADTVSVKEFAHLLGVGGYPEPMLKMNPYGAAFSIARTRQMGIDATVLAKQLDRVTNEELQQAVAAVFKPENRGAAVLTPAKK